MALPSPSWRSSAPWSARWFFGAASSVLVWAATGWAVIAAAQRSLRVTVDGKVGPATLRALGSLAASRGWPQAWRDEISRDAAASNGSTLSEGTTKALILAALNSQEASARAADLQLEPDTERPQRGIAPPRTALVIAEIDRSAPPTLQAIEQTADSSTGTSNRRNTSNDEPVISWNTKWSTASTVGTALLVAGGVGGLVYAIKHGMDAMARERRRPAPRRRAAPPSPPRRQGARR